MRKSAKIKAAKATPTPTKPKRKVSVKALADPAAQATIGPGKDTKGDRIIALLRRPEGVSIEALCEAVDWQTHSVRGFLSGAVKKKLGLTVASVKAPDGTRIYRVE